MIDVGTDSATDEDGGRKIATKTTRSVVLHDERGAETERMETIDSSGMTIRLSF